MLQTALLLFFSLSHFFLTTQSQALNHPHINGPSPVNQGGILNNLESDPVTTLTPTERLFKAVSGLLRATQPVTTTTLNLNALDAETYGPRQNLEPPANAVELSPGDDINAVMERHPAGTTFLLKAGVYRNQSVRLREGDVLAGEYGAELNGARLVTEVARDGDYWVLPGQTQQGEAFDKCFPEFPACKYPEQVFIGDRLLSQVASLDELRPGAFYFDYRGDKIYLLDNPEGRKLEVSVTPQAIEGAPGAVIRNLSVTKYAQTGDWMTVRLFPDMVVEYSDIGFNAATGLSLSDNVYVHHNRIHHSGRLGVLDVKSENIRFEYNEIAYNNTSGYDFHWEAGGTKFLETRDLSVTHNYVHHNFGPGLWTDYDNRNTVYEYNTVRHNTGNGIFHEVSGAAVIRFNDVDYNGVNGIEVSNSFDTDVYGNTLEGNASGLWAKNACRSAAKTFTLRNVRFYDNVVYQDVHYAEAEGWPTGKAAALFAERSCSHWQESFEDWFDSVGNEWYDNTYYINNPREDARPPFFWKDTEVQLEDWQAFGLQ